MLALARRLALGVGLVVASRTAFADPPPRSLTDTYSPYELAAIQAAERELGGQRNLAPEGKRIESVELVGLDPIEPRDPLPTGLNVAHVRTRSYVIERELLLRAGDTYAKVLADESARNLRALPQQSLVACFAMHGSAPDRVRFVVVTKDVWSLILDADFDAGSRGLSRLLLEPKETNLLGTHHTVLARFVLDPGAYALGGGYRIPRVQGRWLTLVLDANAILNRESGRGEGSFGAVQLIHPFRTDRSEWSWFSSFDFRNELTRKYDGSAQKWFLGPDGSLVPYEWHTSGVRWVASVTRSFGWRVKNNVSLGVLATRASYELPPATRREPEPVERAFRVVAGVPASNRRAGPTLEWHGYTSDFLRTFEVETLGLQEDFRLGHAALVRVSPAFAAKPAGDPDRLVTRRVVGLAAGLEETLPLGNGFARVGAETSTDYDLDAGRGEDSAVMGRLRLVTPRTGFGRLVEDARVTARFADRLNTTDSFGGDGRLRGFPNAYLVGRSSAVLNLEYRTPALEVATEQVGLVIFYDLAGAGPKLDQLLVESAAGFGIRIVTPMVERVGLRIDFGFPIHAERVPGSTEALGPVISATFGQAFGVTGLATVAPPRVE